MKKIIPLFVLFTAICNVSFSQFKFGVQFQMGTNSLYGISPDTLDNNGYSGAKVKQNKLINFSPAIIVRRELSKSFSLESGIGYLPINHDLQLKFYHSFFKYHLDKTFAIRLRYIEIPLKLNYKTSFNDKSALILAGGLNTKILIIGKDNYQNIILEEIGLPRDRYNKLLFSTTLAAAYQIKTSSKRKLEAGFFANLDMNSMLNRKWLWGFYNNLDTARGIRYGIQIKYFIN